jgi:hypothetical protein
MNTAREKCRILYIRIFLESTQDKFSVIAACWGNKNHQSRAMIKAENYGTL